MKNMSPYNPKYVAIQYNPQPLLSAQWRRNGTPAREPTLYQNACMCKPVKFITTN